MATTTATITLASSDIMDNSLSISNTATLTKAGTSTGLPDTTGLSNKRIASAARQNLLVVDQTDATASASAKVYIKNTGTSTTKYATIGITSGDTGAEVKLGRLYGGDWMFIPWNAVRGAREVFTVTCAGAWAIPDTAIFDGVTATCGATETAVGMSAIIAATTYRNWDVTVSTTTANIFTAKYPGVQTNVTGDWTVTTAGDGSIAVAVTTQGTDVQDDITVTMDDATETVIEYMAIYE
jgi:hypothetical protein